MKILSVCLSVIHPFIHLPFIHLSVHLYVHSFIHLSIHSSIYPSIICLLADDCQGKITSQVVKSGYQADMKLDNIKVFGVQTGPSHVTINGQTAVFQYNTDAKVFFSYV